MLNCKHRLSLDRFRLRARLLGRMEAPLSQYEIDFLQRTTEAREGRYTQQQMADLLGISQSRYSKYEIRSTRFPRPRNRL